MGKTREHSIGYWTSSGTFLGSRKLTRKIHWLGLLRLCVSIQICPFKEFAKMSAGEGVMVAGFLFAE